MLIAALWKYDGATIANSGSTNTAGWSIRIWSNATAACRASTQCHRPQFPIPQALSQKFFRDVQAAKETRLAGRFCMKSVSFGTRLIVEYHGWNSPDLSCPTTSALGMALTEDVERIVLIAQPPNGFRRIRVPIEPHRVPSPAPGT
jgi:hypothetical protein